MRIFSYIFTLLVAMCCLSAKADEQLLWWLVTADDTVEDWYGSESTVAAIGATDARLRVMDSGGNATYLDFYVWDDDGEGNITQVKLDGINGTFIPVEAWADVSGYTSAEYSFAVELGNFVNGEWVTTLVNSEPVPYNNMQSHIGSWSDIQSDLTSYWIPSSYSVPEPSSGLLMLIGGVLLALRRRKGQ